MNFSFPVVFVVLGLMFVLCDDCSRELYDAFTRSRQLTEKCYENCLIHDSEIISGEKNWTGLCFRNRHLFFSDWQCRDKDFEIADVGLFVLATHNFCTIKTPNDVQVTDLDCLRKFNAKQCSINNNKIINSTFYEKNRTDIDRGSLQIGEENTPLYTFRSPSVSTPNGSFNNNRSLTIFSKIPVSGQSTNNGTETSIFREEKTTSGSTVKVPELHKWLSTTGSAPNPCESYEKFFNDYCYFLKNFKHIIKEGESTSFEKIFCFLFRRG